MRVSHHLSVPALCKQLRETQQMKSALIVENKRLKEQRDRLAEAMRAMWPFIEEDPPCGGKSEIQQYLQALAAVKGGSDE
jgi:hypothetical protein